jgi:hypothetical protein
LYLCTLAYQTADGGILGSQAPDRITDNGNVDTGELLMIPLEALRDEDANGIYERLHDPQSPREYQVAVIYGYEWRGQARTGDRLTLRGNPWTSKPNLAEKRAA